MPQGKLEFIDIGQGDEVTVDASSLGGTISYIWVQMIDENDKIVTPRETVEFRVVYTLDSQDKEKKLGLVQTDSFH